MTNNRVTSVFAGAIRWHSRMKRLCLLLLFFLPSLSFAQNKDRRIIHFNTENGLPQNSVSNINFDKQGYCWLSTEMGLVRFDGKNLKTFDARNIPGLTTERMRNAVTDSQQRVFIVTGVGQLLSIKADDHTRASIPQVVADLPPEANARPRQKNQHSTLSYSLAFSGLSGQSYTVIERNLYYGHDGNGELIYTEPEFWNNRWLMFGEYFISLKNPRQWKLWYGGKVVQKKIRLEGPLAADKNFIRGKFICTSKNQQHYVYAGTTLYAVRLENETIISTIALQKLAIPSINTVYYHSRHRKYYIGSLISGLYIIPAQEFQYLQMADNARDEGFFAQAVTRKDEVICERYLYNKESGSYSRLHLAHRPGASVCLLNDRFLYYGENAVLRHYDIQTGKDTKVSDLDTRASSIYADKYDATTLLVTTGGVLLKIREDEIVDSRNIPRPANIMSSVQHGRDTFLLATQYGLKWYDYTRNKIFRTILDSFTIRAVVPGPEGEIWISTYGAGFYLYEKGKVQPVPVPRFTGMRTVHAFIEDGKGFFWMPTNNGLFKVERKALLDYARGKKEDPYFYLYSVADGLRTNEFNGGSTPSYVWLNNGWLSLPSIEGLVQFDPLTLPADIPSNKIYIDEIRLEDSVIDFAGDHKPELSSGYRRFSLRVSSPYFGNRENLRIVYRVKDIDNAWLPLPDDGQVQLNLLPAGDYEVQIKKMTGAKAVDMLMFRFSVKRSFFQTWSFYLLVLALLILLVLLVIRIRIRLLIRRNKRLEEVIRQQTQNLADTVSRLQFSEAELLQSNRTKDMVNTLLLHDLRSPIRFMHTMLSTMARRHAEMPKEEMAQYLSLLEVSTASLNDFTQRFFTWAGSQHKDFRITVSEFSIRELFEESSELYGPIAELSGNKLEVADADFSVSTDKNILSAVIRNLLDNACKHTRKGTIRLSAEETAEGITICVSDTGTGFSAEAMKAFHDTERLPGDNGNGSLIMQDLLNKIGAAITIRSNNPGAVCIVKLNVLPGRDGVPDHRAPATM